MENKSQKPKISRPRSAKAHAEKAPAARYFEGVGRRKTAVARVRLSMGRGKFTVNGRDFDSYFRFPDLRIIAREALEKVGAAAGFDVSVVVKGSGIHAQAEAVRHGSARALVLADAGLRPKLHAFGFLRRDPRMVERKKYGLKKARRAPQWAKR